MDPYSTVLPSSNTSNVPHPPSQNFSCAKKIFFALAIITAIGGIVALVIGNLGILPSPYDFVAIVGGTASFGIGCSVIVALMLKNRTGRQHIHNPGLPNNQGRNGIPPLTTGTNHQGGNTSIPLTTDPNSPYYGWTFARSDIEENQAASNPPPVRREGHVNPNDCSNDEELARRLAEEEENQNNMLNRQETSDAQIARRLAEEENQNAIFNRLQTGGDAPTVTSPLPNITQPNPWRNMVVSDSADSDSDENEQYMIPTFNQRNLNPPPASSGGNPANIDCSNDEEIARRLAEGDQDEIYARLGRNNAPSNQNNPTPQVAPSLQGLPRQNDVDLNGQIPPPSQEDEDDEDDVQVVPPETIDAQSYRGFHLRVNRQHMRQDPQYHLDKFYDLIQGRNLDGRINVKFIKNNGIVERGVDMGGLTNAYINNLFSNVLERLLHSSISESSGLFYPTVNQPRDKTNLEKLGRIIGYCKRKKYPIGAQFDSSLFAALLFGFNAQQLNTPYDQLDDESKKQVIHSFIYARTSSTASQNGFEYEEARLWDIVNKSSEEILDTDLKFIFKYALKKNINITEHEDPEDMSEEAKQSATHQREQFQLKFNEFFLSQHGDIVNENTDETTFGYASQGVALKDEVLLTDEQFINKLIISGTVKVEDESLKTYKLLQDEPIGTILTEEELLKKYRLLSEDQYAILLIDFREVINDLKEDVFKQAFEPYTRAFHALANGYKSTLGVKYRSTADEEWAILQSSADSRDQVAVYTDFQIAIQGAIDREFIAANIKCFESNAKVQQKTQWLRNWILQKASVKQIKEFLVFASGNSSLSRPIKVVKQLPRMHDTTANQPRYTPFPVSHTCSNRLEIAPGVAGSLESLNDATEESFCNCIEAAILGACEDGGEFNVA